MDDFFVIHAIGDFEYLSQVLTALALFGGSDGHRWGLIASVGTMIGLLLAAGRSVVTGGKEFEIQYILIGFIVFALLFGSNTRVWIENAVPSNNANPGALSVIGERRPVDNVPYGVAVLGVMISKMGYGMTTLMEQAFSSTSGYRVSDGGFGKTLDLLSLPMALMDPRYSTNGPVGYYTETIENYLTDCYLDKKTFAGESARALYSSPNVCAELNFESEWSTTEVLSVIDGSKSLKTCRQAYTENLGCNGALINGRTRGQILSAALRPSVRRGSSVADEELGSPGGAGQPSIIDELEGAFESVGATDVDAEDIAFGALIVGASARAMAGSVMHSPAQMQQVMLAQASGQRASQWAAEETMFRRVMRPMMSFFEAMVYAIAPFACFLIGLGRFGLSLMVKYLVLTIWVQLWLPVLAIVNLYMNVQASQWLRGLSFSVEDGISPDAMLQFWTQSIEWVATAGMLAAATPALTFMLIFGGAYSAQALAGRLQGGDHVSEKQMSPDLVQPGAVVSQGPQSTWDSYDGLRTSGSAGKMTQISYSDMASRSAQSSEARVLSAQASLSEAVGNTFGTTFGVVNSGGTGGDTARRLSDATTGAVTASRNDGISGSDSRSNANGTATSSASSENVNLAIGAGASADVTGGTGTRTDSNPNAMPGTPKDSTQTGSRASLKGLFNAGASLHETDSRVLANTTNTGTQTGTDHGSKAGAEARYATAEEHGAALMTKYSTDASFRSQVDQNSELKQSFTNALQEEKRFQEVDSFASSAGASRGMDLQTAGNQLLQAAGTGGIRDLRQRAIDAYGGEEVRRAEQIAQGEGVGKDDKVHGDQIRQGAALAYLASNAGGNADLRNSNADDTFREEVWRRLGMGGPGNVDAYANQAVGEGGRLETREISGTPVAPAGSAQQTVGEAGDILATSKQKAQSALQDQSEKVGDFGPGAVEAKQRAFDGDATYKNGERQIEAGRTMVVEEGAIVQRFVDQGFTQDPNDVRIPIAPQEYDNSAGFPVDVSLSSRQQSVEQAATTIGDRLFPGDGSLSTAAAGIVMQETAGGAYWDNLAPAQQAYYTEQMKWMSEEGQSALRDSLNTNGQLDHAQTQAIVSGITMQKEAYDKYGRE